MLKGVLSPPLGKERDIKFRCLDSSRFTDDKTKDVILILFFLPPESSNLACAWDATCNGLVDVDMLDAFIVLEMLDSKGNCPNADRLSLEPADTL